jgi:hypothetical protein
MADKKKKDKKKPAKKTQGGKKNSELSMDDLKKVSGGRARKRMIREP